MPDIGHNRAYERRVAVAIHLGVSGKPVDAFLNARGRQRGQCLAGSLVNASQPQGVSAGVWSGLAQDSVTDVAHILIMMAAMPYSKPILRKLMIRAIGGLAVLACAACTEKAPDYYQGYAEGEFVMVAAASAGRLEKRWVNRGQQVAAKAPLFALEDENERAARREAEDHLTSAEARLANLETGKRAPEVDAARAQSAQASAARELSIQQLRQQEKLFKEGFISQAKLDEARAAHAGNLAKVAETEAQVRTTRLPVGRNSEIAAAQADVEAARAALAQSDWRLKQRAVVAPAQALVHDTFYSEGEWVPAGSPVASLLPPGNIKLRFFVPETMVGALATGQAVSAVCDGCDKPVAAKISYIARQAEYTPPVIYSRTQRAKLVFLIEARPEAADAVRLRPGQPLDVTVK